MNYSSRYKRHPAGECSLCHKPLGELYLTLSRIKLSAQVVAAGSFSLWADPEYGEVIAAYCPSHRVKIAKDKLDDLGIASTNKPLTPGLWRCGCCGINPVDYRAPNTLYVVSTMHFNGYFVEEFLGELVTVLTCIECETSFTDPDSPQPVKVRDCSVNHLPSKA